MATLTKSVFLYGIPTQCKKEVFMSTQREYTNQINHFIVLLSSDKKYFLDIFNNNCEAPVIRELEKQERKNHNLGSAYGQNAIDHAVKELHNQFTRVRNSLYGICYHRRPQLLTYAKSIALLNACLNDRDECDVLNELISKEKSDKKPSQNKLDYYGILLDEVISYGELERKANREEIRTIFYEKLEYSKKPYVTRAPLQLDSRLCTFEVAENIKSNFVLKLKLLNEKNRVAIPLTTSANSLRRLSQYKTCSPSVTLENNKIKVIIPFKKKVTEVKGKKVVGADVGITDLIHTSDNKSHGTFQGMDKIYEETVESKSKIRSNLRNLMRRYQKEMSKTECPKRKEVLNSKIRNIANMLNGNKNFGKAKRKYAHEVNVRINTAVKTFLQDIKYQNVVVALESLDITEFDRGAKANKRNSNWIRGQLVKKLQSELKWNGIKYIEVDPAYTSKACPNCHNIDRNNRKYKSFECTVCKQKSDADYNASINISKRALDTEIQEVVEKHKYSTPQRHGAIKKIYRKRHEKWLEENQTNTVAI